MKRLSTELQICDQKNVKKFYPVWKPSFVQIVTFFKHEPKRSRDAPLSRLIILAYYFNIFRRRFTPYLKMKDSPNYRYVYLFLWEWFTAVFNVFIDAFLEINYA